MSLEEEPLRTGFPDCSAYLKAHLRKEFVAQFAKLFFVTGSEQPLSMFIFRRFNIKNYLSILAVVLSTVDGRFIP